MWGAGSDLVQMVFSLLAFEWFWSNHSLGLNFSSKQRWVETSVKKYLYKPVIWTKVCGLHTNVSGGLWAYVSQPCFKYSPFQAVGNRQSGETSGIFSLPDLPKSSSLPHLSYKRKTKDVLIFSTIYRCWNGKTEKTHQNSLQYLVQASCGFIFSRLMWNWGGGRISLWYTVLVKHH